MLRVFSAVAFAGFALALPGCGGEGAGLYPIEGEVLFENKPLDKGNILFEHDDLKNPALSGATIENGKFSIPKNRGLKPGVYVVRVSSADPNLKDENQPPGESNKIAKDRIPASWNSASQQKVDVVSSGPNQFKFVIK